MPWGPTNDEDAMINRDDDLLSAFGKVVMISAVFVFFAWTVAEISHDIFKKRFDPEFAALIFSGPVAALAVYWPLRSIVGGFGISAVMSAFTTGITGVALAMGDEFPKARPVALCAALLFAALTLAWNYHAAKRKAAMKAATLLVFLNIRRARPSGAS